jgi:putative transposase
MKRKLSTRLNNFDYTGIYIYFVTCLTYRRNLYFTDKSTVDSVLLILNRVSDRYGFTLLAYCFMPDHLHLLIEGDETSSLRNYMQRFKQVSSYIYKKQYSQRLWQRSYYDHVLRKEQSVKEVAGYIVENPVRKGIVTEYNKYPFAGSVLLDSNDI